MKCLVASLPGNPWQYLERRCDMIGACQPLIVNFVRCYALYRLLPTGYSTLEALVLPWPILGATRDRTVSFVMRTYIYDGINYREI